MSTLLEYKCPNCGGKLEFDASTQQMKCPYCDSEIDITSLKMKEDILKDVSKEDDMSWEMSSENEWNEDEKSKINVYSCNSCGGEIIADETTGATHCPYCGNPVVMTSKFKNDLKPDLIIPFSVTREQAKDKLKELYKGKKLLPKVFSAENHLEEIKGIYVPVWLFDAKADASVSYSMKNIRSWSDSNYRYTETSFFDGFREGSIEYTDVPVDGASKMPDEIMESIEPFDVSKAVEFNTAYLSGFLADRYDVEEDKCITRANERIKKSTEDAFMNTISGYTSVSVNDSHISLSNSKAKYALYPVWLLTTKYAGEQYLFAVNGQNGKIVGNMPVDKSLANKYRFIYTLIAGAVSYAVIYLFMHFGGML